MEYLNKLDKIEEWWFKKKKYVAQKRTNDENIYEISAL